MAECYVCLTNVKPTLHVRNRNSSLLLYFQREIVLGLRTNSLFTKCIIAESSQERASCPILSEFPQTPILETIQ